MEYGIWIVLRVRLLRHIYVLVTHCTEYVSLKPTDVTTDVLWNN